MAQGQQLPPTEALMANTVVVLRKSPQFGYTTGGSAAPGLVSRPSAPCHFPFRSMAQPILLFLPKKFVYPPVATRLGPYSFADLFFAI